MKKNLRRTIFIQDDLMKKEKERKRERVKNVKMRHKKIFIREK